MKRNFAVLTAFVIGASVTALAQNAFTAKSPKDAVTVDPVHHHVVMENDRVRVFEVQAKPGDKSPMHTHPPLVVVSMETARLRLTTPDGKSQILDLHPSQVIWFENAEHSWELLAGKIHLMAVEVKPPR
jgi:quercetin dioxygenase-like cupin family protein